MTDAQSVLMGGTGGTSWSWKGVEIGGGFSDKEILEIGQPQQAKRFGTDELKTWPDGNPVLTVPVKLLFGDEDERTLWVEQSTALQKAIAKATVDAKAKGIEVGGRLTVVRSGTEDVGKGNPRNLFTAQYVAPGAAAANNVLMGSPISGNGSPSAASPDANDAVAALEAQLAALKNDKPPF